VRCARDGGNESGSVFPHLVVERNVSASTQNQALSAILFLYRDILKMELPWLDNVVKAKRPQRMPVVSARDEGKRFCLIGMTRRV
jgi:Phage integrase, N-terminal SAM-like domain